jgi:glycine cleavage system H protein
MTTPDDLLYHEQHGWVRADGGTLTIGVTEFGADGFGDIVAVWLPAVGDTVTAGEVCGELESTRVVWDFFAPVSGMVTEINPSLGDDPAVVGVDPYGEGWLFRVAGTLDAHAPGLLDAATYRQQIDGE